MSREQQLRTVRAVSLNRAIDEHPDTRLFPWEPNLIDYRHSLVIADKRADEGDETLEICAYCGCEVDTDPAPHKPGCNGIGKPRANGHLALEEAAEPAAGVAQQVRAPSPVETEVAGSSPAAGDGASPRPGAASSSTPLMHRWTRDEVIAALQRWAKEHGHTPTQTDWHRRGDFHPTFSTAPRVFGGSWSGAIAAAGLTPRGSAPRTRAALSERDAGPGHGEAAASSATTARSTSGSRSVGAVTLRDALCLLVHATRTTLDALERELTIDGDPGELARVVVRRLGDDT